MTNIVLHTIYNSITREDIVSYHYLLFLGNPSLSPGIWTNRWYWIWVVAQLWESWASQIGSEREDGGQTGYFWGKKKSKAIRWKGTKKCWLKFARIWPIVVWNFWTFKVLIWKLNFKLDLNYLRFSNPPNRFTKPF